MKQSPSIVYPSRREMLAERGVVCRADGSYAEDSYDYGVWWRDLTGRAYRLTWIGSRMREPGAVPGELYLENLQTGAVELLCTIPPVDKDGHEDDHVEAVLTGWPEECGAPNSNTWVRARVADAIADGLASRVHVRHQKAASHV